MEVTISARGATADEHMDLKYVLELQAHEALLELGDDGALGVRRRDRRRAVRTR